MRRCSRFLARALIVMSSAVWAIGCGPAGDRTETEARTAPEPAGESSAAPGDVASHPELRPPRDVVLVTVDTTRADRIGAYGNRRIETPAIDGLAEEGILFELAFTPVPSTLPSHASIMTSLYPARHGVHDNGVYRVSPELTTLAERFRAAGYRTGAFVSAFVLDDQFGLDQGFEIYDDRVDEPLIGASPETVADSDLPEHEKRWVLQQASPYQRRADAVTPPALGWLEETAEPVFLWIHYFDPHMSYSPPPEWVERYDPGYDGALDGTMESFTALSRREGWRSAADVPPREMEHMIARYDGEISFMDRWIGRLFDHLRETGRWDDALVVVVGDHGEGFGEHSQIWEHNGDVFDEVVRVPLVMKLPGGDGGGERIADLVRTLDVGPTILELAGLSPFDGAHGRSLLPLLEEDSGTARPEEVLLEARRERQAFPVETSWLGLRSEAYKLVLVVGEDGAVRNGALFDLLRDPGETTSVLDSHPRLARRWSATVLDRYREMKAASPDSFEGIDEMTSEALRSLGYVE